MGHLDELAPEIAPEATDLHVESHPIGDLAYPRLEVGIGLDRTVLGVVGDPDGQFVAGLCGALRDFFERPEGAVGPIDAEEHFHAGSSVPRGKTVVPGGEGLLSLGPEGSPMANDASPDADPDPDERDRRATGEDGSRDTDDATGANTHTPDDGGEGEEGAKRELGDDPMGSEPPDEGVPADVQRYERFKKIEGASYERANGFLRDRTHITAREWAIARLCTDFRTATGVEMTKIGENLPRLVPFMTDTYSPQAVNQARASFEEKIRKAGATFLYGAMSDFFTAEELDDVMYEATEVAKFLLEVEGADLAVESELAAEDRIQSAMREVHRQSAALRHDTVECPHCEGEVEPSHGDGEED